jgi:ubiquitin-protein ligase
MEKWWEVDSLRWRQEKEALDATGFTYVINGTSCAQGAMALTVKRPYQEHLIELTVTYPEEFPFFPPVVATSQVVFARHQTPGDGRLCLLGDDGNIWEPETHTLAWLLTEQWDRLLAAQPGPTRDIEAESRQAEPITAYLDTEADSFVGVPEFTLEDFPGHGKLVIAIESLRPLRGTILELQDAQGSVLALSDTRDRSNYANVPVVTGRWTKLDARLHKDGPEGYYRRAAQSCAELETPLWQRLPGGARIDVIALLFPDELVWEQHGGNIVLISKTQEKQPDGRRTKIQPRLHHAELESHRLYAMRDPLASSMKGSKVALVGLGSIGSPLAKLIAQAGIGKLDIVDFDQLQAGNAIRWEVGRAHAGRRKAQVLGELIHQNFPYTRIVASGHKVGDPQYAGTPEAKRLSDILFERTDCLVDASAATNVTHYLARQAQLRSIPFVWLYATNGAWGGFVGAADPNPEAACWMCHQFYLTDKTIEPLAAAPELEVVHAPQCLDPTFTGSQMDLAEVSLMAARLIRDRVRTANGSQKDNEYPWNFATLRLRDASVGRTPPVWTTYRLGKHVQCPYH